MSCLFPRNVTVKQKNGTRLVIPAPCGRCPACLSKQRLDWFIRNKVELQNSTNAFFVTLTYNDANLPISECSKQPCFSVDDIQKFIKRFRKKICTTNFKYFLASEYGGELGRPHYHAIFYNVPDEKVSTLSELLAQTWGKGFVSVAPITDRRVSYVCKYMLQKTQRKKDYSDPALAPFYLSSRRPAIGRSYINDDNILHHLGNKTTKFNLFGLNTSLPSYYKRKIFDGYEHIKEDIRNDYLSKVHRDFVLNCSTTEGFLAYTQSKRNHAKATLRSFKKYSKKTFQIELNEVIDFQISNLK